METEWSSQEQSVTFSENKTERNVTAYWYV